MSTTALTVAEAALPDWITHQVFPFESRFAEVAGIRFHYCDEGNGPAVLLLHGSPLWSHMYTDVIASLRPRFRCIAVDLPGLGLSAAPLARGRAFSSNADALEAFVNHLGLRDFVLAMHATAGPSALAMATRMPERVRGLTISNSFAWNLMAVPAMAKFVRIVSGRLFGFLNFYLNLLPRLTARFARRTGPMTAAERAAVLGPYRRRGPRHHLQNLLVSLRTEAAMFDALEPRLALLHDKPALLAFGAHDRGYQAGSAERFAAHFPKHRLEVFDNAGHFPLLDQPKAVAAAMRRFLHDL